MAKRIESIAGDLQIPDTDNASAKDEIAELANQLAKISPHH